MILITHDLGVVADVADDIVIMYAGRPMERADVKSAFIEPHHPYTQGLLESIPCLLVTFGSAASRSRATHPHFYGLPKSARSLRAVPYVQSECRVAPPPLKPVGHAPGHVSACILPATRVGCTRAG